MKIFVMVASLAVFTGCAEKNPPCQPLAAERGMKIVRLGAFDMRMPAGWRDVSMKSGDCCSFIYTDPARPGPQEVGREWLGDFQIDLYDTSEPLALLNTHVQRFRELTVAENRVQLFLAGENPLAIVKVFEEPSPATYAFRSMRVPGRGCSILFIGAFATMGEARQVADGLAVAPACDSAD